MSIRAAPNGLPVPSCEKLSLTASLGGVPFHPVAPALPAECSDNGLWTQVRAQYQAYNGAYTTATSLEWQIEFNNRTTNETLVSAPVASAAAPSGCVAS